MTKIINFHTTNSYPHEDTHAEEIPELVPCWCDVVGQADDEDDANDHNNHLLSINEFPAEGIPQEAERKLSDDIANVCCSVDCSTQQEWVYRSLFVPPAPISGFSSDRAIMQVSLARLGRTYSYVQMGVTKLIMKRSYESRKKPTLMVCQTILRPENDRLLTRRWRRASNLPWT